MRQKLRVLPFWHLSDFGLTIAAAFALLLASENDRSGSTDCGEADFARSALELLDMVITTGLW
jgi:hypothetical protein